MLGPLRVERDGIGVPLGPQLTALTSTLLLEPGAAIPARRLIDLLWTGAPPDGAAATLRSHVSHLRTALGPDPIVTVGRGARLGYRLDIDPDAVDSHRFASACAHSQRADDATRSLALLDEALALWRGPAYADIAHQPFALPQIARLQGLRQAARRDRAEALSASYLALGERERTMFRVLGLFPGAAIGVDAAASLAGTTALSATAALAVLAESNMVTELPGGRFSTHDLLRAYAFELATPDAEAATGRLVDHYLHTAEAAERLLRPHRHRGSTATATVAFDDQEQAMAWLAAERPVLLALLESASTGDTAAAALARAMTTYLHRSLQPAVVLSVATSALRATERTGDAWGQADALRELGLALIQLDRHSEAADTLDAALERFRDLDDYVGTADTHLTLGWLADQQGRLSDSLDHDRQALALFVRAGDVAGQARALNAVGWDHSRLGSHAQALRHCRRAVRLHEQRNDTSGAARAHDSVGYALHHLGRYSEALTSFEGALSG
ncbi:hypothetical protein Ais01nite_19430 [Asanoa ishikariensis]|uniref:Tetratricopeptide repeat-containing protein n=1 Tax=Asanoa ishikariensis TaxID=137265 RepID=A0A1H3UBE1_9ACTN|nr:tetratricopeptide repeat protein [Asanoa ishikariensis]GIF63908.1 hypothetical protein Ais01nite_19430 [Asanoa ishikariensis]SDZ59752.1 Tetratricopeptide repeat-containing protein [Asanoa ishikariensis]